MPVSPVCEGGGCGGQGVPLTSRSSVLLGFPSGRKHKSRDHEQHHQRGQHGLRQQAVVAHTQRVLDHGRVAAHAFD